MNNRNPFRYKPERVFNFPTALQASPLWSPPRGVGFPETHSVGTGVPDCPFFGGSHGGIRVKFSKYILENKKLFAYCISLPPGGRGTTQWGKEPALRKVLLCFMLRTLPQSRRAVPAPSRMEPYEVSKRFL